MEKEVIEINFVRWLRVGYLGVSKKKESLDRENSVSKGMKVGIRLRITRS